MKMIFAGFSLLLTVLACNLTTQQATTPAFATLPAAAPVQPTDNLPALEIPADLPETYTDELVGFSLNYPAGWRADPNPGNHVMLFSYPADAPIASPGSEGVPDTVTKIDFLVAPPNDHRSLEQEIADMQTQSDGPGGRIVTYDAVTLPSGIRGYRIIFTGGMAGDSQVVSYILQLGERKMYVTAYGDTSPLESVVSTLRLNDS